MVFFSACLYTVSLQKGFGGFHKFTKYCHECESQSANSGKTRTIMFLRFLYIKLNCNPGLLLWEGGHSSHLDSCHLWVLLPAAPYTHRPKETRDLFDVLGKLLLFPRFLQKPFLSLQTLSSSSLKTSEVSKQIQKWKSTTILPVLKQEDRTCKLLSWKKKIEENSWINMSEMALL